MVNFSHGDRVLHSLGREEAGWPPEQVMDVVEKKEKLRLIGNRIIIFDMFEIKEYAFASAICEPGTNYTLDVQVSIPSENGVFHFATRRSLLSNG
jgi:hypothetical protein